MPTDRWTDWRAYDATEAMWPPSEIQPGVIVEADLVARVTHMEAPTIQDGTYPIVAPQHRFNVVTGEAFIMNPPWDVPTTHIVCPRYRVWQGTQEELDQYDEALLIEDLSRIDLDAPGITDDDREIIEILIREAENA